MQRLGNRKGLGIAKELSSVRGPDKLRTLGVIGSFGVVGKSLGNWLEDWWQGAVKSCNSIVAPPCRVSCRALLNCAKTALLGYWGLGMGFIEELEVDKALVRPRAFRG